MSIETLLLFLAGFVFLIAGAELLVRGASRLAVVVGISPLVVGLTVVAYGTSAPELAVTIQAVYAQPPRPDIAVGNVIGSNISNVLLVLGISALAAPLIVSKQLVRSTVPLMIGVSLLVWGMASDGQISRLEGGSLFAGAVLFSAVTIGRSRRSTARRKALANNSEVTEKAGPWRIFLYLSSILAGLVILVIGARWLVGGATVVARLLGVSELVIGLTIVAVGTSLPEIATSLIASLRGHREIAVGNVVGSNIFNLLLVLGFCALVAPMPLVVAPAALRFDIPVMVAVGIACWPIFYRDWEISRWEGGLFLAYYVAYAVFLFLQATSHPAFHQYEMVMAYFVAPMTGLVLLILAGRFFVRERRDGKPSTESE